MNSFFWSDDPRSSCFVHILLNCSNSLEIHDGGSLTSAPHQLKLVDGKTKETQSRTNQLWVKYVYTQLNNATAGGFAFQLAFSKQGTLAGSVVNGNFMNGCSRCSWHQCVICRSAISNKSHFVCCDWLQRILCAAVLTNHAASHKVADAILN